MILLITVRWPPHKSLDVGEKFFKSATGSLPPSIKKWLTFSVNDLKGGKGYHLIYTERDKADEASEEINKIFAPFFVIEGYTIKTEILVGMKDAAKLMKYMK